MGLICGLPVQVWAAAGDTVSLNGSNVLQMPEWAVGDVAAGGKLLLSDSPEEFYQTGVLYQDEIT
ncbi:MAG TPA: copper amine oxidase, partial [Firmicutes bacterium]|nr:copper amine oxidase [Bacillota bacterium]